MHAKVVTQLRRFRLSMDNIFGVRSTWTYHKAKPAYAFCRFAACAALSNNALVHHKMPV
jgi:hypothetical protein